MGLSIYVRIIKIRNKEKCTTLSVSTGTGILTLFGEYSLLPQFLAAQE